MDALIARWMASNKNPQHLFPGTQADINLLLQEWMTQRKQSHTQSIAVRTKLHAISEAFISEPTIPDLSIAQKQKIASELLELFSQANVQKPLKYLPEFLSHWENADKNTTYFTQALDSAQKHETLLATYLLSTLTSRGYRKPHHEAKIRVDEAVCDYFAGIFPGFDRGKELSLLVDFAEEERSQAKRVEIAKVIRERVGIDVFEDTESRAREAERLLAAYVEKGPDGMME